MENIDIEITTLETSLKRINEMLSMTDNTAIDMEDLRAEKHNCVIALRKAKRIKKEYINPVAHRS